MKVVIIEDEPLAAKALARHLNNLVPEIDILDVIDTVEDGVLFFKNNTDLDLAFLDIQLADGLSFEILNQVTPSCPLIFTTAYDAYALQAFSVHSIDYLLKPVSIDDLERAIDKWKTLTGKNAASEINIDAIKKLLQGNTQDYKERFLVKIGEKLISMETADILFLQGENKIVWLHHKNGRKYPIDYTLEQLESLLDPTVFFRLNRSYITHRKGIQQIIQFSNSRLKIELVGLDKKTDVIVSRAKAEPFRHWLGK